MRSLWSTLRRPVAFASALFLATAVLTAAPARAAQNSCHGVDYSGVLVAAPGQAVRRVVRLDTSCRPVITDEVLAAQTIAAVIAAGRGTNVVSEPVPGARSSASRGPGFAKPQRMVAGGPIHEFNRIKDAIGLLVTSIDPHNFSYGYNGSTITTYGHDATVNRAVDTDTSQCGPGWSIVWSNTAITISGGGVGSTFIDSLTHAEFSYLGRFDCSGTQYYNILDTKLTGFGNGSSSTCAYRTQLRNTFFGWYQELLCWDAFVWTTPPAF